MEENSKESARYYLKQIFCRHTAKTETTWVTRVDGLYWVRITTKVCNRCGRHFRLDSNDL